MKHSILIGTPVKLRDNDSLDHLTIGLKGTVTAHTECGNGNGYEPDATYQVVWESGDVTKECFEFEVEVIK